MAEKHISGVVYLLNADIRFSELTTGGATVVPNSRRRDCCSWGVGGPREARGPMAGLTMR